MNLLTVFTNSYDKNVAKDTVLMIFSLQWCKWTLLSLTNKLPYSNTTMLEYLIEYVNDLTEP